MKIELTRGYVAIADDEDADLLLPHKWTTLRVTDRHVYAFRKVAKRAVLMHRVITGAVKGQVVDHINGNTLDNRRNNLRLCTHAQNMTNRAGTRGSKSKFKGVTQSKRRWVACIGGSRNSRQYLGIFATEEEAAAAYDIAAVLRYGEFACLNFPHVFPEVGARGALKKIYPGAVANACEALRNGAKAA